MFSLNNGKYYQAYIKRFYCAVLLVNSLTRANGRFSTVYTSSGSNTRLYITTPDK